MANASLDLTVQGMTCQGCVRAVEKKLLSVPGVESAQVDLANSKASVSYDHTKATPADLIAAVGRIGYEASQG